MLSTHTHSAFLSHCLSHTTFVAMLHFFPMDDVWHRRKQLCIRYSIHSFEFWFSKWPSKSESACTNNPHLPGRHLSHKVNFNKRTREERLISILFLKGIRNPFNWSKVVDYPERLVGESIMQLVTYCSRLDHRNEPLQFSFSKCFTCYCAVLVLGLSCCGNITWDYCSHLHLHLFHIVFWII